MKKRYEKPDIMFDNFTMSESVARCEEKANFARGVCGVEMGPGWIVFTNEVGSCIIKQKDLEFNSLCYHAPIDSNNVFNS
jgi:hypothetical protein